VKKSAILSIKYCRKDGFFMEQVSLSVQEDKERYRASVEKNKISVFFSDTIFHSIYYIDDDKSLFMVIRTDMSDNLSYKNWNRLL
jgi:hypothetical protein